MNGIIFHLLLSKFVTIRGKQPSDSVEVIFVVTVDGNDSRSFWRHCYDCVASISILALCIRDSNGERRFCVYEFSLHDLFSSIGLKGYFMNGACGADGQGTHRYSTLLAPFLLS